MTNKTIKKHEFLKKKLNKLTDKEIDKAYKKLGIILSDLRISKNRKIAILLSELDEKKDYIYGIKIGDLEKVIKTIIKERK